MKPVEFPDHPEIEEAVQAPEETANEGRKHRLWTDRRIKTGIQRMGIVHTLFFC